MNVATVATTSSAELFTTLLQDQKEISALKGEVAQLQTQLSRQKEKAALTVVNAFFRNDAYQRGYDKRDEKAAAWNTAQALAALLPENSEVMPLVRGVLTADYGTDTTSMLKTVDRTLEALVRG